MAHVVLNDLHFTSAFDFVEDTIVSEPTGNILKKIKFTLRFRGLELKDNLLEVLGGTSLTFKTIDTDSIEFKAKGTHNWSYTGNLDEDTLITSMVTIEELDKDLPEDHNVIGALAGTAVMNWIRTRALSSLLIKRGIITDEEYVKEINEIADRDFENLRKFIGYGIPEPERKIEKP